MECLLAAREEEEEEEEEEAEPSATGEDTLGDIRPSHAASSSSRSTPRAARPTCRREYSLDEVEEENRMEDAALEQLRISRLSHR